MGFPAAASWNTGGDWTNTVSGAVIATPGIRGITGDTVLIGPAAVGDVDLTASVPAWRESRSTPQAVRQLPRAAAVR